MLTLIATLFLQELPNDAQQVVNKAQVKVDALRRAYEESVAKVRRQEMADLQRVHDAIKKGDPVAATLVKARIDQLAADVGVVMKGRPAVEQWIQGKWILAGGNYGEVWEFKGQKVIGTGVGDRVGGRYTIENGNVQVVWDSGLVEWIKVPEVLGDETTGVGRIGNMTVKRVK